MPKKAQEGRYSHTSTVPLAGGHTELQAKLAFLAHAGEAIAAVNGAIGLGLKGNLRLTATSGAGSGKVLAGAARDSLASVAAILAALGLVLEPTLGIELLLTTGEHELLATFFTYQSLVFVHDITLSLHVCPGPD